MRQKFLEFRNRTGFGYLLFTNPGSARCVLLELRRVMVLFPVAYSDQSIGPARKLLSPRKLLPFAAGLVIASGTGILLVSAADNPRLQQVIADLNRPLRAAVEPILPRSERSLVEVARAKELQRFEGLAVVTRPEAPRPAEKPPVTANPPAIRSPLPVAPRTPVVLPAPALPATTAPKSREISDPVPRKNNQWPPRVSEANPGAQRARATLTSRGLGEGMPMPTNYCVRLCDGFVFPIGQTGIGQQVQEVTCRSACPAAQTALFTLPAGARDLSALSRGGAPYTALPTAFRYQKSVSSACSCRPTGSTQSANAFYSDVTLKPGDVIMTGAGAQHFDGAKRFPFQPNNFGEAVSRLNSPREIALVRALEVASVRGALSPLAPQGVRARIIADIQKADSQARNETANPSPIGHPRGFVELQARTAEGITLLPVVKRAPGLVALN
jgi:hypothetical protein